MPLNNPPRILFNDTISSKFLKPSLTSHYICRFAPDTPQLKNFLSADGSNNYVGDNQELIEISCSDASLPGASLMTNEINDDYTGSTERHAYRRQYDDRIDFTFYVDSNYAIIEFFERWISYCVGENDKKSLKSKQYSYRVNFPSDYQTDSLYITKFERDYQSALEYNFIGAYPISIASMPISYDSSQLLKCTVSFTYIRYMINRQTSPIPNLSNAPIISESYTSPFDYNYELGAVPGQFTRPPGQGGAVDLLGGIGGIGVRNPGVR